MYLFQRQLQYFPTFFDEEGKGDGVFEAWKSESGNFLGYFRPSKQPKRVILFFHGNAGEALDRVWLSTFLANQSLLLILVEYPGYGARRSESISEHDFFSAAEVAFDEAKKRWNLPITVLAESLGSGVATYLASVRKIDRLGLLAPFSSAVDVAQLHYPFLPVRWLMKDKYESLNFLKEPLPPLYVVHGAMDKVVPLRLGRKLYDAYPNTEKNLKELPNADHNDLIERLVENQADAEPFKRFLSAG